jgi:hypothetical protein
LVFFLFILVYFGRLCRYILGIFWYILVYFFLVKMLFSYSIIQYILVYIFSLFLVYFLFNTVLISINFGLILFSLVYSGIFSRSWGYTVTQLFFSKNFLKKKSIFVYFGLF